MKRMIYLCINKKEINNIKHKTMNTQVLLNRFSNEIKSISLFAKRIKFDLNGDITELVRLWINDTKPFYQEENKEQILLLLKSFI